MDEIVNRVAQSKLQTVDLEDYYVPGRRVSLDLAQWLDQGFILREKQFREMLGDHDWAQYQDTLVSLHCSTDAIVPAWAYMLVTVYLQPYVKRVITGDREVLETVLYQEALEAADFSALSGLPVIVKGCSDKPVPANAYLMLIQKIQPLAKSILYGEACSSVPLYKKK